MAENEEEFDDQEEDLDDLLEDLSESYEEIEPETVVEEEPAAEMEEE